MALTVLGVGWPIVVGVDGSVGARAAVRWAVEEGRRRDAALRLVHVRPRPAPHSDRWDHEVDERGRRVLAEAGREVPGGAGGELVMGDPAPVLAAESERACLVVLGVREDADVTGSVVVPVIAHARCPVVVVRGSGGGPVVVGVDATAANAPAVEFAAQQAVWRDVPLHAVMAVEDLLVEHPFPHLAHDRAAVEEERRAVLADLVAGLRARWPHVAVEGVVRWDSPDRALAAAAHDAGLLVVGRRGHHVLAGALLGSTSQALALRAPCPLAVVHDGGRPPVTGNRGSGTRSPGRGGA